MVKGRICPSHGARGGANAGGVGTQAPGPEPGTYGTSASSPSPFRAAITAAAADSPAATPASLAPASAPMLPVSLRVNPPRSEEHTSELQSHLNLVCRLLLEKKKNKSK